VRKEGMMKRPIIACVVGAVTLLACSCPLSPAVIPEPAATPYAAAPSVDSVTTCKAVDEDYKPIGETTDFYPDETFYCSVAVSNLEAGSAVRAEWFYRDEWLGAYTYTAEKGGSGYIGFNLVPAELWSIGDYAVEIYLEDELIQTISFSVVSPE
jgi:hypothetical protein